MRFHVPIYDEFVGDFLVEVDVVLATDLKPGADVIQYNENIVAAHLQTNDGTVPPHIDMDIRHKAMDMFQQFMGRSGNA